MSKRAEDLAGRLKEFNDGVIAFVEGCSEECWRKQTAEDWPVGAAARHIGDGHYSGAAGMGGMIVRGEKLPEYTMDQINGVANQHAREHAGCTRAEVLDVLKKEGAALVAFVAGLSDADLDRTGHMAAIGRDISTQKFVEMVVLMSAAEHFANLKAAAGK